MRSIIIRIGDDISDLIAVRSVVEVIRMGRISRDGECYCFAAEFNENVMVFADKLKSDIFRVEKASFVEGL